MKSICAVLCFLSILAISKIHGSEAIHVMILSGQNNHNWQETTPEISDILTAYGQFKTSVNESPHLLTKESLKDVDVILSNWNTYEKAEEGKTKVTEWSEAARRAYIDFVANGGGHVVLHAGSSSFPDWDEYHEIGLAHWEIGFTAHGPNHSFDVRIDQPDHPITQGIEAFTTFDELWHRPWVHPNAEVLASSYSSTDYKGSGNWEPSVLIGQYQKGRCFTILLGDRVGSEDELNFMNNPQFRKLLYRGTQWVARNETHSND